MNLQYRKHQVLWEITRCLQQGKFAIRTHLQFEINVIIMQNQIQSFPIIANQEHLKTNISQLVVLKQAEHRLHQFIKPYKKTLWI